MLEGSTPKARLRRYRGGSVEAKLDCPSLPPSMALANPPRDSGKSSFASGVLSRVLNEFVGFNVLARAATFTGLTRNKRFSWLSKIRDVS